MSGLNFTLNSDGDCGCPPNNGIGFSLGNPNTTQCYNPCPHAHQFDGGSAWSSYISSANSAAWVGKVGQWNGTEFVPVSVSGGAGTVTSVAASIGGAAITIAGTPITTSGTLAFSWAGNNTQYVAGDGSLVTFPTLTSGTVTSVSVVTNQGVSGSVATATTTPAITLTLGALTGVTSFNGLVITANTGVVTTGTWNATVITVPYGGTGLNSIAQGDLIYGSAANTYSALPKDTNATRYLSNSGASNNPAWSQITLTNGVTGVLPIANGGTNSSTALNNNRVMVSSGGAIVETTAILPTYIYFGAATTGLPIGSANLTWDDTNKRIFGASDITFGKSTSYFASFVGTTVTLSSANTLNIDGAAAGNGTRILFGGTIYSIFQTRRIQLNNYASTIQSGNLGGSVTLRQTTDFTYASVTATGAGTALTTATSWNANSATETVGVGDRVSSALASSTYATVLSLTNTILTLDIAIGDGTQRAVNVKPATFRVFSNAATPVLQMIVSDRGYAGFGGVANPSAWTHIGAGSTTIAPLKFTTGTNLTTAEVGAMEYNNTFHLTNSDATRRHIVLAASATKTTAGAPYTNDGYITVNIGGTDVRIMTTA